MKNLIPQICWANRISRSIENKIEKDINLLTLVIDEAIDKTSKKE